jgi:hypothetical protein
MPIAFASAIRTLLTGGDLRWPGFAGAPSGSITLPSAGSRRLLEFLLHQTSSLVANGNESLFPGLIRAWKDDTRDPAQCLTDAPGTEVTGPWRLQRIEASNFGGLTLLGGDAFDMDVGAESWCIEGQNGSGKTALVSSILWAFTGLRVREHVGPINDKAERAPVLDDSGLPIGNWPSLVAYPRSTHDLRGDAEVWVRLTFIDNVGEIAQAFRRAKSIRNAMPVIEAVIDPRLQAASEFIESGLLMPARLTQMSFGEDSQSLYEAVMRLTGLDQLADVAKGVADHFTHYGRRLLKYARDQGLPEKEKTFGESIREAEEKGVPLALDFTPVASLKAPELLKHLDSLTATCSTGAEQQLGILKAEISSTLDLSRSADREKIRDAVSAAKILLEEKLDDISLFAAWASLTEASRDAKFLRLPSVIEIAERSLQEAKRWHVRQAADQKLRLKALAAQWFEPGPAPVCALCDGPLATPSQQALAQELSELKREASAAERKLVEVCNEIETNLRDFLPEKLSGRLAQLHTMEPRAAYVSTMLERFVEREPIKSVLTGFASVIRMILQVQEQALPAFTHVDRDQSASATELAEVVRVYRLINQLQRLIDLTNWWSANRTVFVQAFSDLRGKATPDVPPPENSVRGQIKRLEEALAKAEPYESVAKHLTRARNAADLCLQIRAEQKVRDDIREALLPLKDLRLLVESETARSISQLSGQIDAILGRIHLKERLAYRSTKLQRKEVIVHGSLTQGMKIDATLIANTSWLRAILWAFILALREETIRKAGLSVLPLLVLDDPQQTFDPRNKWKWGEELARVAASGGQVFITTHDHDFYVWLTEREKMQGRYGMIAPASESCGPAAILSGGCLTRLWNAADPSNDDAKAREYIRHVRIHAERMMKILLRGQGSNVQQGNFQSLRNDLQQLSANNVRPYDGAACTLLLRTADPNDKAVALLSDAAHSESPTIGVAQAGDVRKLWEERLERRLYDAIRTSFEFASFHGDSRTFVYEPTVVTFPAHQKDKLKAATLIKTGIAAAARTDGRAGDGLLTLEEWEAARLQQIRLPNHDIYRLTASTLEPVATAGDIIIVSNYAKVRMPALVLVAHGRRLLARRYNEIEGHPEIAMLTAQAINPYDLAAPVIVKREGLEARKVVGTLFTGRTPRLLRNDFDHEFEGVSDFADYWSQLDGARLFKVTGRSAEPIALNGQYLMTREPAPLDRALSVLDGKLVVAVDEEGTKYFKRLRSTQGPLVILESLNADQVTGPEVLSLDPADRFPRLVQLLPVIGVLFELPTDA